MFEVAEAASIKAATQNRASTQLIDASLAPTSIRCPIR